jgi:anaerobic selenocysteine-containing dehydrogenase
MLGSSGINWNGEKPEFTQISWENATQEEFEKKRSQLGQAVGQNGKVILK